MKNAIVLHGMPSEEEYRSEAGDRQSEKHWIPWIRERLIEAGIETVTPELPEPYRPDYEKWKAVFEQLDVTEDTILIGHSCGAGFLVRWLSEHAVPVGKVVLVAPWLDPKPRTLTNGFFEFEIDATVKDRIRSLALFSSTDDDEDIQKSVAYLKSAWPSIRHFEFSDKQHFTESDLGTRVFPELAREVL